MTLRNTKISFASFLLTLMIAYQIVMPLSAHAQLGVRVQGDTPGASLSVKTAGEPVTQPETFGSTPWILRYVVNPIARGFARAALTALTQQVVNWISANGGNNVGFVGNFETTLQNELDDAAGEFLDKQLPYVDFCGDIGSYLRLNLRLPAGGFRQRARCSLTAIVKNVQSFYDNFQNGGWEAFLKTNVDIQNNTAGAFLIALDAKIAAESRRKEEFGAKFAKSSILGVSQKTQTQCFPRGDKPPPPTSGYRRTGAKEIQNLDPNSTITCMSSYEEQTPGTIIEQTIKDNNKTGIDFGIKATEFDEAIGAIMTALLQRTISSASGIFGNSGHDYGGADVGGKDIYNYKEITASQDTLRKHIDAAIYLADGTGQSINTTVLGLRQGIIPTMPPRQTQNKSKTADLLAKNQTVLSVENQVTKNKQSSFNATLPSDITKLDSLVTQSMNQLEPIATEVGASPYAAPTGDMKTDALNDLTGARIQLAGTVALVNQAVSEIDRAIQILNAEIAADQAQLGILQPQLALLQSQLQAFQLQLSQLQSQLSNLQSQLSTLQSQKDTLDSQLAVLQSQLAALQAQLAAATSQTQQQTLQQQILVLQAQIAAVQQQIAVTQAQIGATQGQIAVTQAQIGATQGQITTTQGQITATQGQVTTTSQQIRDLNAQILADQNNILNLINDRATLTTGSASQKGILTQLQEADTNLLNVYSEMQNFVTISEVVGETGLAISAMNEADTTQASANVVLQAFFAFLDRIVGN